MFRRLVVGPSTALALLFASTAAQAQSCYDLRAQLDRNRGNMLGIALDFPKTHAALAACLAGNDREEDAKNCAATMLIGACLFMGPNDCGDLMSRWYKAVTIDSQILEAMRREGCSQ